MPVPAVVEYENLARSNASHMEQLEQAASRVIRSGWYILGQEVAAFEAEFARYVGARHCIGVGNGLDALTLSIEAMDLPPGSDVLVASNTYIATMLAIIRAGHRPVLVEPVRETFNIDPDRLRPALTANTRALCVTHLFGKACRMAPIVAFVQQHGLKLIEDCAQSHGARWNGKMTGTFGDAGCFSFFPTKNLGAAGDGGAVVTDDDALAERLTHLRNYGSKQQYVNRYIGANSRLDEIQAAILRVKLQHLDAFTSHKRGLADIYFELLPEWVSAPARSSQEFDVFHIFAIRDPRRDALRDHLLRYGIKTAIHYPTPPHRQEAMRTWLQGEYPIADELHRTELSLPISYGHTPDDVRLVCAAMHAFSG